MGSGRAVSVLVLVAHLGKEYESSKGRSASFLSPVHGAGCQAAAAAAATPRTLPASRRGWWPALC